MQISWSKTRWFLYTLKVHFVRVTMKWFFSQWNLKIDFSFSIINTVSNVTVASYKACVYKDSFAGITMIKGKLLSLKMPNK